MNTLDKLKKWLGIKDYLKMYDREKRGIYTTSFIPKNKIIIRIKSKYLLEFQQIYLKYPIDDIEEANSLLAFYLTKLYFDNDEFWSNYINTLPTNLSSFPYFWLNNELNLLKSSSIYSNSNTEFNFQSHLDKIHQDWEFIYEYNQHNEIIKNITYDNFYNNYFKFRILVGSRVFGYEKYGIRTSGMVPYIDLLNHSEEPNTSWYFDNDLDSFVLVSIMDIPKGTELTDNYGNKTNGEFLLYYGFTIESNPTNILYLSIQNKNYSFDLNYDLSLLSYFDIEIKTKLKNKLKKIYLSHTKNINLTTNYNIKNILNDEIKIIKLLIENL